MSDEESYEGTRPPHLKNGIPCEAFRDWPEGSELCNEPAVFEVERAAQVGMTVCAAHLGPILQYARDVVWPPCVWWIGPDHRPRNSLARGGPEIKERERMVFGS